MGKHTIIDDLKDATLHMKAHAYTDPETLKIDKFSTSTLTHTARHKWLTGSVTQAPAVGHGQSQLIFSGDLRYHLSLTCHMPGLFLDA